MRFRFVLVFVATGLVLLTGHFSAQQSATARERLRVAIDTEVVDGDLRRAIVLYQAIVDQFATSDRDVAATALVHLAGVFDKMGDPRAEPTLQRVLTQFGDQPVAAEARRRRPQQLSQTPRWSMPRALQVQAVAPDGRSAAFIGADGNVLIRTFESGVDRPVTDTARRGDPTTMQGADVGAAFSRDGRQLAYHWFTRSAGHGQLRIAAIDGQGVATPRVLVSSPEVSYIQPFDWTPDGSAVVAAAIRSDLTVQVALISARNGALRVLKSIEWDRPSFMQVSPDGRYVALDLPASDEDRNSDVFVLAMDGSLESRVAPGRSHDLLAGWSSDGRHLIFASNRSGVNGLYAVPMANGAPTSAPFVVKPELGQVRLLGLSAGRLHYEVNPIPPPLEIRTAPVDFAAATMTASPLSGQNPAQHNSGAVWSPDGTLLAYESQDRGTPSMHIVIRSVETDRVVRVLRPKADNAGELRWAPDGRSFLTLSNLKGRYAISRLDAESGELSTVVPNPVGPALRIRGQSWSADGARIYYRHRRSVQPVSEALVEKHLATGAERDLHVLEQGLYGTILASPDGRFLAVGRIQPRVSETTLLISTVDGTARELAGEHGEPLRWTPDGQALWMAVGSFPDQVRVVRVPIDGSARTVGPRVPRGWGIGINPDGTRISFFTSEQAEPAPRELWALDGLMEALGVKR